MPQISYINGKPYFEVRPKGVPEPTLSLGEAGAAELVPVKDPTVIEKLDATSAEFEQQGIAPITDQNLINKLEGYEPIESTQGVGEKPPLLDQFSKMMTPPPEVTDMPLWKKIALTPTMPLEAGAQMATGVFANTAGTVADRVMQMFGRSPEERQQIVQNIQQGLTYQPIDPRAAYINQVMAAPFSLVTEATGEIPFVGGIGKELLENIFAVAPAKMGVAKKPVGKTAPFTMKQVGAQELAQQYNLPTLPSSIYQGPLATKSMMLVNAFKNNVAPLFEKTHDVINNLVEGVKEGYKSIEEQIDFKQVKGGKYESIYGLLPEKFNLPELKAWAGKKLSEWNALAEKRKLSPKEIELRNYLQELYEADGYTSQTISDINGKSTLSNYPSMKKAAKFRVHEGLKSVENGPEVSEQLGLTNKEYRLSSLSRIMTNFLDRVTTDGLIDPDKWNRQYNNFKLNNIDKMPDVFDNLDQVNKIVQSFGKELSMYKDYLKNPQEGKISKIMSKIAEYGLAGGVGGKIFNLPGAGESAAIAGGILGIQQAGKAGAKSLVQGKGRNMLLKKGQPFEGFKGGYEDWGMERPPDVGGEMEFNLKQPPPREPSLIENQRGSFSTGAKRGNISEMPSKKGSGASTETNPVAKPEGGIIRAIKNIVDADNSDSVFGLRVIPDDMSIPKRGEKLSRSWKWEDGEKTKTRLHGTSTIIIDEDVSGALQNLHDPPYHQYSGDKVVLVKGKFVGIGEDIGEGIIENAKVVEIFDIKDIPSFRPMSMKEYAKKFGWGEDVPYYDVRKNDPKWSTFDAEYKKYCNEFITPTDDNPTPNPSRSPGVGEQIRTSKKPSLTLGRKP